MTLTTPSCDNSLQSRWPICRIFAATAPLVAWITTFPICNWRPWQRAQTSRQGFVQPASFEEQTGVAMTLPGAVGGVEEVLRQSGIGGGSVQII